MDKISSEVRRRIMRAVGRKNTGPEVTLRSLLHGLGYRYKIHDRRLPGTPDIVFPSRKRIIFVHGCFWHGHACRPSLQPKSRTEFWQPKIERNSERDRENIHALQAIGWQVAVVWECELAKRNRNALIDRITSFLGRPGKAFAGDAL